MDLYGNINISSGDVIGVAGGPTLRLATRSVETKAGWVGQVVVNGKIVWESSPTVKATDSAWPHARTQSDAHALADEHVQTRLAKLFGED